MKITKEKINQLIAEEIKNVLGEGFDNTLHFAGDENQYQEALDTLSVDITAAVNKFMEIGGDAQDLESVWVQANRKAKYARY